MKSIVKLTLILSTLCFGMFAGGLRAEKPDLVLFITVDQLRGDMPMRIRKRLGPGGFRHFLDRGSVYTNAYFSHLVTTTAAGHATLATGASTPGHGMAANEWYDHASRQPVYNTEDRQHPLLGVSSEPGDGRSPRKLLARTFSDELVNSSAGRSRVYSVSLKDRGAIIPAGQSGKAFWYSKHTGKFITSSYYYPELPAFAVKWNAEGHADRLRNGSWSLLHEREQYVHRDRDDRWFEKPAGMLGRTFPHPLSNPDDEAFYSALRSTPMGDELTLSFLKALVESEQVGRNGHTDILAVSFSSSDYIGHDFGPDSLEVEDNLLRLDRTLQDLLRFIDERVGLDKTLVVLSSDHGVAPSPERMQELGVSAAWHQPKEFMRQANETLRTRFHTKADLVLAFLKPGLYLDETAIAEMGLELATVERELARGIAKLPGFFNAFSRSDLVAAALPVSPLVTLARRSTHPERSGNVIVVQDPFWLLSSDPEENATTHGSPYAYDTHVPIMLTGPGINQKTILTRVSPRDVAPTLCALLAIPAPATATGSVLPGLFTD